MSKQSYINGFCKAAAANGVDPKALAQFAVQKEAQDAGSPAAGAGTGKSEVWAKVMEAINKAKAKTVAAAKSTAQWYGKQNQATKALIGAGLGSAVGTGLGAALAGKKGLRTGAILGAVGGGAGAVDWKALAESFSKLQKEEKKDGGAAKPKVDSAAAAAATAAAAKAAPGAASAK